MTDLRGSVALLIRQGHLTALRGGYNESLEVGIAVLTDPRVRRARIDHAELVGFIANAGPALTPEQLAAAIVDRFKLDGEGLT